MRNDEPKRTAGTGTVVDSSPRPLPGLVPVPLETQIQEDRPGKPLCVSSEALERYALRDEIGRGGMGVVYYARDTRLNRDVAVKVLQDRYDAAGAAAARFFEEARITGQLQHHGIPPVHDLGTLPDGRPFMAMKLIRGHTLSATLAAADRPDPTRLLEYFGKICDTVAYAHAKHVIHRDLKPSNVMVGAFGEVQVMDWGLAKVLSDGTRSDGDSDGAERAEAEPESNPIQSERDPETHTQAGSAMGTPAFMPPEQAKGEIDRINARADVFCLGGILCEMLTGKPPYTGTSAEVRAKAALGHVAEAHARLDACGADPEVIALAKACLTAEPAARPADAKAVADAVTAYRSGLDARLRKAEVDRAKAETQVAESRKRARLRLILVGLGLVLVLVATVYNIRLGKANEDTRLANDDASRANRAAKDNNALTEEAIDQFVAGLGENDKLKKYDDLRDVRRKLLETAVDFNKKLLERGGDEPRLRYKRGEVYRTLGLLYIELENLDQSAAEFRSAKAAFTRLLRDDPEDDRAFAGLASAANRLGNTLERIGRKSGAQAGADFASAAREYDEAIRLRRILFGRDPSEENRIDLATTLSNLAGLCSFRSDLSNGRPDPAALFREAEALLTPLVAGPNPSLLAERQFAKLQTNFAAYLFDKNLPEFPKVLATAKDAFDRIVRHRPDNDELRFEYVLFADKVGHWWYDRGEIADAEKWLTLAAKECGAVVDAHPGVVEYRMQYADTLLNRAVAGYELPDRPPETVLPLFRAALDQIHRLYRDRAGRKEVADLGTDACDRFAAVLTAINRHADVVAVWDEALTFIPPERKRGIELRREFARVRSGDVTTAVKNARTISTLPLKTAEECGYFAAVLAVAADASKNGKPLYAADEIARFRGEVKTLIDRAKGIPDFERVQNELIEIPSLKPFLPSK